MNEPHEDLADFGWSPFFQSQLSLDEFEALQPARVVAMHRDAVMVARVGEADTRMPLRRDLGEVTVGDWVLTMPQSDHIERLLERKSVFRRKVAGREARVQLIAANVDTLLIVTSCNNDFNPARIERYLALAGEAGVMPVLVLTKLDLAEDADSLLAEVRAFAPDLLAITCDARDPAVREVLAPWLGRGQTMALVGSSGVGKSTLINTLAGVQLATAPIREDDSKGRHTTTTRSLHRLPGNAWLLDTPGMRELQLADAKEGVETVFADIVTLEAECRFTDCQHDTEPGCAVQAAIATGVLDPDRLKRFRKLQREDALNTASIAERHARFRVQGKLYRSIQRAKRGRFEDR